MHLKKRFWKSDIKYVAALAGSQLLAAHNMAAAAILELEDAAKLGNPYCVDMRIAQERQRALPATRTRALSKRFNCRRTYILPLSVRPDEAMVGRYAEKLKVFSGHRILVWCTHGVRTRIIQRELGKSGLDIHSIRGGTLYLEHVFDLAD